MNSSLETRGPTGVIGTATIARRIILVVRSKECTSMLPYQGSADAVYTGIKYNSKDRSVSKQNTWKCKTKCWRGGKIQLPQDSALYIRRPPPIQKPNRDLIQRSLMPWLAYGRWGSPGCNAIRSPAGRSRTNGLQSIEGRAQCNRVIEWVGRGDGQCRRALFAITKYTETLGD